MSSARRKIDPGEISVEELPRRTPFRLHRTNSTSGSLQERFQPTAHFGGE